MVTAKQRTQQEIKQRALEALSKNEVRRAISASDASMEVIQRNDQLTVIGGEMGFAVIANDDQFPAVLGYSDKKYVEGEVAPGYQWWVDAITEQLKYNQEHGLPMASVAPDTKRYKSRVDALLVTEWGQSAPYYNQTPTYTSGKNEVHYVTGCVATAMSQIMYYHKWPVKGKGSLSYYFTPEGSDAKQKLSANLAKAPYDWDNMLPVYKGVKYTEAQAEAVSTLMMHCGYSVNMQYTKSGSGAFTSDAADALRKRFYYNENMHFYWRSYFPEEEWMECIFRELNDNCPVLYGAQRSDGGHEFVIDGYNESGQVHVNWGWDGSQNGFFDIASLNGYTSGQEMVLVRKNDAIIPYQSYWGMNGDISITLIGTTLKASFGAYNLDYNAFTGKIGLMAMNLADGTINSLASDNMSNVESLYGANVTIDANVASMADGKYRLYAGTLSEKEENWQPIRCAETNNNSYLLTVNDGKMNLEKENNANWTGIDEIPSIDDLAPVRYFDLKGREVNSSTKGLLIRKQGNNVRKVFRQ